MPKSTNNNCPNYRNKPSKSLLHEFFFKKYTFEYVLQQQQKRRLYKEPAIYP